MIYTLFRPVGIAFVVSSSIVANTKMQLTFLINCSFHLKTMHKEVLYNMILRRRLCSIERCLDRNNAVFMSPKRCINQQNFTQFKLSLKTNKPWALPHCSLYFDTYILYIIVHLFTVILQFLLTWHFINQLCFALSLEYLTCITTGKFFLPCTEILLAFS